MNDPRPGSLDRFAVAYVTDSGLFLPTLRSAYSALRHTGEPLRLMFVGLSLEDWMWQGVEQLQNRFPHSRVERIELPDEWMRDAKSPKSFITPTALGRLFLPRLTGGRVLYLDGDTLVTGDVSQAANVDLGTNMLAGVRDFAVMKWRAAGKSKPLQKQADILGGETYLTGYVNSGVLLMNCDAIRETPGLQAEMEDMVAAQGYPTVDQDRINVIFRERITHLDAAWNCSWGRLALQRRQNGNLPTTAASKTPLVLHFHGPKKPWHPLRISTLKKGALGTWRYRREMAEFDRVFAGLAKSG